MTATDAELIIYIAAGNRDAFAELYGRYAPRVLGLLVKLLPRRSDADDVLQEAFFQIWKSASAFDPERGSVVAWIFLIARSRAVDALRRRRSVETSGNEAEPATTVTPDGCLEKEEEREQVRQLLTRLPDEQRRAIEMAFYGGLTHVELAEKMDLPLGTVKTRIRLGMRRLRDMLAAHGTAETMRDLSGGVAP